MSTFPSTVPKPMVRLAGSPMLTHIMQIYARHGYSEFVVAVGYLGEVIKDFFVDYHRRRNSLSVDLGTGDVTVHESVDASHERWLVHLLDTRGADSARAEIRSEFETPIRVLFGTEKAA